MKLPEPFFLIINPIIRMTLRSPLHAIISDSLMLITFTGRKSQRVFTTPVRFLQQSETVWCFTSPDTHWWRNLRGGAEVTLRIKGMDKQYHATVVENDPKRVEEMLKIYLEAFPQDAAYHDIDLNKDKSPIAADLERAALISIIVEAKPVE